jgi:hypothetical protein
MDVIRLLCALTALTPDKETPVGLPNQQEVGCAPAQSSNVAEK